MNNLVVFVQIMLLSTVLGYSQGTFLAANFTAPTRLDTADGPLANSDFWAHFLVGGTPETLLPIWLSAPHHMDGTVGGAVSVSVPEIACLETAYIQMVAWDGRYWGTSLENVPVDQLGRTDIVPHVLTGCNNLPVGAPQFIQPAVVPAIPEPSMVTFCLLGSMLASAGYLGRSCRAKHSR
jgi:hypothetical protein